MIDLHCHILPNVDDGPQTLEDTFVMARAHAAAGVRTVAATPHVSPDVPTSAATMTAGVRQLEAALREAGIDLEVVAGGEIAHTRVPELDDAELRALALGAGPWLLVESPLTPSATDFDATVHALQARGHRVLLAHPERCPAFQREPQRLAALVHAGMLTSITAGALVGRFGRTVERFTRRLVQEGLVHSVASDAHDILRRPPGLADAVEQAGYRDHLAWWCEEVPAALLAGGPLPARPQHLASVAPRRGRSLLRMGRGRPEERPSPPAASPRAAPSRPSDEPGMMPSSPLPAPREDAAHRAADEPTTAAMDTPTPPPREGPAPDLQAIAAFAAETLQRAQELRAHQGLDHRDPSGDVGVLLGALAQVARRLEAQCSALEQGEGPAPSSSAPVASTPAPAPAAPAPSPPRAAPPIDPSLTPEETALQMVARGADRGQVETYLRQHFERGEARRLARRIVQSGPGEGSGGRRG